MDRLSTAQQWSLVTPRTVVGWHFFYEGFYKLSMPGWTRAGRPLTEWSAGGYLVVATGPLGPALHRLAQSPAAVHAVDLIVPIGLALVGLPLMLGVLTQIGCAGAIAFLTLFYVSAPPLSGLPQSGAEGAYLLVNKNLVELAAVAVLMTFRTGLIAGLDMLWAGARARRPEPSPSVSQLSGATR